MKTEIDMSLFQFLVKQFEKTKDDYTLWIIFKMAGLGLGLDENTLFSLYAQTKGGVPER
jgi:hypothetical protein